MRTVIWILKDLAVGCAIALNILSVIIFIARHATWYRVIAAFFFGWIILPYQFIKSLF